MKKDKTMKKVCLYHNSDLDGQCSAAIIKRFHPEVKLIGCNYGQKIPWGRLKKKVVFVVDVSLPTVKDWEKLYRISADIVWNDHHKTAIDLLEPTKYRYLNGLRDTSIAACELTWKHSTNYSMVMPRFVKLIGEYDSWRWTNKNPLRQKEILDFQYAMRSMTDTRPNAQIWDDLFDGMIDMESFSNVGSHILRYEEKQNALKAKNAFVTTIDGYSFLAMCGVSGSHAFESVIHKYPWCNGVLTFNVLNGGWSVSLYSDRGTDCSEIAKKFGGGGHQGAAGFRCTTLPFSIEKNKE